MVRNSCIQYHFFQTINGKMKYVEVVDFIYGELVCSLIGVVSAWDTRQNKCFMHWKSDSTEICKEFILVYFPSANINDM